MKGGRERESDWARAKCPHLNFIDIETRPISFQFRTKITHVLSKYANGEKKVLDHQVTPAAPGCPKSSSFYTGVNLVPVNMAGMATMGNGRQATTAAAMAANRSKTMAPNLPAEDPTRVSKIGGRPLSFSKVSSRGAESLLARFIACLPSPAGPPPLVLLSLFVRRIILSAHRPKLFSLLVWLVARINRVAKST